MPPAKTYPSSPFELHANGRDWLLAGSDEPAGYGGYGYLLLRSAPRDAERERPLRVMIAYLRQLPAVGELGRYARRDEIRINLLPLRELPAAVAQALRGNPSDADLRRAAELLLDAYDHARAQAILARLGVQRAGDGPFLITLTQPASAAGAGKMLIEDMSAVEPAVAEAWMRQATRLGQEPQAWSGSTLRRIELLMRNSIAQIASALPDSGFKTRQWVVVARYGQN